MPMRISSAWRAPAVPRDRTSGSLSLSSAILLALAIGALCISTGCPANIAHETRIVTDTPDLQLYVDYYNARFPRAHIILSYMTDIAPERFSAPNIPDVVIAKNIAYPQSARAFGALNARRIRARYAADDLITPLLETGRSGAFQKLIPLSYNVPLIVFSREHNFTFTDSVTTTLEEIRRLSDQFTEYNDGRYTRVGYSPLWEGDILYLGAEIFGASYRHSRAGRLQWNEEQMFDALNYFSAWIDNESNPGASNQFTSTYFRPPAHTALISGEIGFIYMDLIEFASLGSGYHQQLDFRILANAVGVTPLDDILYIGIPRGARRKAHARDFLYWLLDSDSHALLLEENVDKNIGIFGFAGALPITHYTTTFIIPRYYPWLIGRIPTSTRILPVSAKTRHWHLIKDEVVIPWLENHLRGITQRSLAIEIEQWIQKEGFR